MMTAQERRDLAMRAIGSVKMGGKASDFETQTVDFKEEGGSRGLGGVVGPIGSRTDSVASALAKKVACMANTEDGGVLIIGVADNKSGEEAFVGAQTEAAWLKQRIWALTQPNLTIEIEEIEVLGKRLLLMNIPDALREINVNGKLQTRVGSSCVELSGEQARQFLESRRNFDWSAQKSGKRLSEATEEALESARIHFRNAKGTVPDSNRELASRLGILCDNEDDPELTRAGALLLCRYEPAIEQMHLMITDAEGIASRHSVRGPAPLLPLFDDVMALLLTKAFPSKSELVGTQRRNLRSIPELALRESIVNAIMHRDYRIASAVVVALATGSPSDVFKVISPGGLLPGISITNLISTPSRLRNPNLADAFRTLGLAEKEGVGIDTIYREMMKEGHPEPEIIEQDGTLVVRLSGGQPDLRVLEFFTDLGLKSRGLPENVRVIMAIRYLLTKPTIRPEGLASIAQCSRQEAVQTLEQLEEASSIERLLNGSLTFRLNSNSRTQLNELLQYSQRSTLEEQSELVMSYLDSHTDISREEVIAILDVKAARATAVLKEMVSRELLGYVGPTRGRNVRYKKK